ncbi:MAG: hypothetical protein L3J74_12160, partial [Bacteroidales bacterium]|nr:hypothetical protein [Bacteroidales bacterium]
MKKITLTLLSFILTFSMFAGGLVTNTNQSAAWTRMLNRNATVEIDAVFFNPAALTKLEDGFHLSISNQIIGQTKSITNSALGDRTFDGDVFAPVYPGLSAAYKTGKFAFSFGFYPVGGGGSAEFNDGLPSIEMGIASLPSAMAALGATGGYSYNTYLEGSSVYFGIQGGISYEINDMVSVFAGARYVMATNTYNGYIKDIALQTADPNSPLTNASVTAMADATKGGGDAMQPLVDGGAGGLTFAEAEGAGIIDAATRAQLEGGLLALGLDQNVIDAMDISTAQNTYYTYATTMYTAAGYLADQELDAEQTGSGITPILGVNLSLMEDRLNIGLKYEFKTAMTLTNSTTKDIVVGVDPTTGTPITMFPNGEEVNADIPALLSGGVSFKVNDALRIEADFETYFDKDVDWVRTDPFTGEKITADDFIDNGYLLYGLGLEYTISDALVISAGWNGTQTGVNDKYQSDLSYSLNTNTFGGGFAYKINNMIKLNIGGYYVCYEENSIQYPGTPTSYYT